MQSTIEAFNRIIEDATRAGKTPEDCGYLHPKVILLLTYVLPPFVNTRRRNDHLGNLCKPLSHSGFEVIDNKTMSEISEFPHRTSV